MMTAIVPIVEGKGEQRAVPILLRRLLEEKQVYDVHIAKTWRVSRNRIVKDGELERVLGQVIRERKAASAVLFLLDADDDCPARLAPAMLETCQKAIHLPVAVVLAQREFEGWLLGAKESLRGARGIREDAEAPENPEGIRGAKERLGKNMHGQRYVEVDDQPALTAKMDFDLAAERCPSFRKLVRDVEYLVEQIRKQE